MKDNDKIIAFGGMALIFILAILAIVLMMKRKNISDEEIIIQKPEIEQIVSTGKKDADLIINSETKDQNNNKLKTASEVTGEMKNVSKAKYEKAKLKEIKNKDKQMEELFGYWDMYHLEAVSDLIHLERIKEFSKALKGTNEFYYYGEVNSNGNPEGKGLAIYADNTYYFGEWKDGLREGQGMLLQIFPDKTGTLGSNTGVTEHQYNGYWAKDLPNGEGQEHYSYNTDKISGDYAMANAIGQFKDGYYDGDIYLMTIDRYGNTFDWYATAKLGTFDMVEDKTNVTYKHPYWIKGNNNDHSTDEGDNGYFWMLEADNNNWGIYGLMK